MKIALILPYDTYDIRGSMLKSFYESAGHTVYVVTSDFSRDQKIHKPYEKGTIRVHVPQYRSNISFGCAWSNHKFARKLFGILDQIQPECIHCLIPANELTKPACRYKRKHPASLLFFDVQELYPESWSFKTKLKSGAFFFVKRDKYLEEADHVFVKCQIHLDILQKNKDPKYSVLYWAYKENLISTAVFLNPNVVTLCWAGHINKVVDIDMILELLKNVQKEKDVLFHVMGKGEAAARLIQSLQDSHIPYIDHGYVDSIEARHEIYNQCSYGLNFLKPHTIIGLSMKCLDYLSGGLPILNSVHGDIYEMLERRYFGFNVNKDNIENIAWTLCHESLEENLIRRENAKSTYLKFFTQDSFEESLALDLENFENFKQ